MAVSRRPHAAFTLVEMLVVITILGVLMALLLPAVNSVRESMRRASCKNNLAQCGKAAQAHVTAQGYYPSDGWGASWVGDPDHGFGARQPGSWIYNILPYAGFDMIHDIGKGLQNDVTLVLSTSQGGYGKSLSSGPKYAKLATMIASPIPFIICPTRRRAICYPSGDSYNNSAAGTGNVSCKTDYAVCSGTWLNWGGGPSMNSNCFLYFPNCGWSFADQSSLNGVSGERSQIQPGQITDGLSNVFFAGEKNISQGGYVQGTDDNDDQCALEGHEDDVFHGVYSPPLPDAAGQTFQQYVYGSAHPAGVNFVFCDGHTQLISYQINFTTYQILGVRNYLAIHPGTKFPENY